jgi:hypothetical protein
VGPPTHSSTLIPSAICSLKPSLTTVNNYGLFSSQASSEVLRYVCWTELQLLIILLAVVIWGL